MALAASKYRSLGQIVAEWAAQSGELRPITLRRICDWAICGGFPDGTFRLPTGQTIDLLQFHRAMRVAVSDGPQIDEDSAFELLRRTIVSKAGIKAYCERIGVDPPPSLSTLTSRFRRLVGKARYVGPPDCPNSSERVTSLEAKCTAIGLMNTMKSHLPRPSGDSKFAEQARERWLRYAEYAESAATASGDLEIQRQLAALKHEWETPDTVTIEAASADIPADDLVPTKRGRGRPPGSGSFESEDAKIVEEMREGILSKKFAYIAAAARALVPKAGGGGTLASIEKRLIRRYAERYPD
jgi:hypothetical protein